MCRCNEKLNFVEDAKGNCVCKKHYVLSNDSEKCVSDGSGGSPSGFWIFIIFLLILTGVSAGTIVVLKKKQ